MDREKIEARIAELQVMLKQAEANGNAILGAIDECRNWLSLLNSEDTKKADSQPKSAK